jgi:hypothetical protein
MCVLFCANPAVRDWLEIPLAQAYRQALQLCPVCPAEVKLLMSQQSNSSHSVAVSNFELDEASQHRMMKRSAWVQAYLRYSVGRTRHVPPSSSGEWQKAFETIAKTWGRLLSLVGLRW